VTWRGWGLCSQRRGPVTWRCWAVCRRRQGAGFVGWLVSLGAGDVALLVGSLGAGGIDELAPVWPQGGAFTGGLDGGCGGRA
jgi:hypothetical protein